MKTRTYRMYGMVPYQLTGIQKGIQYGHALQEYNNMMDDPQFKEQAGAFNQWSQRDKTFIILNGGTTNANPNRLGTLNQSLEELIANKITCAYFTEPDLGDQLTALVFLVDDRVWDRVAYPDYTVPFEDLSTYNAAGDAYTNLPSYQKWLSAFGNDADTVVFLRNYLRGFKLA